MTDPHAMGPPLVESIVAMRMIGRASTVETLEKIRIAAQELIDPLAELVDRLPSLVGRIASDVLRELAAESGQDGARVRASLSRVRDPRNYRELCDGLSILLEEGEDSRSVQSMRSALEPFAAGIRKVSVLLISVGRRGDGALTYRDGILTAGDASLGVPEAVRLVEKMDGWHRAHAGSAVIATRAPAGPIPESFGIDDDDPLWMSEERALVMLPSRSGAIRKIAVEPLPHDLGAPVDLERHARLEFLPGVEDEWRPQISAILAASLRVCSLVLQNQFFSTLDTMSIVVHPEEYSLAYLVPESSTLHVFSGPTGPYVLVHELGHLVDSRLARQGTFRSEEEGSALASFTDAARPMYEPIVDARASRYGRMLADAALPGLPASGFATIEDAVAALPFVVEGERAAAVRSLVEGRPLEVDGTSPLGRRISQVIAALSESMVLAADAGEDHDEEDGTIGVRIDLSLLRSEIVESEKRRLLSAPEIFARFFDQYSRLLADQKKMAFGPRIRPSDLDLVSVGRLAPLFLDSIFHEQKGYLEARMVSRAHSKLSDTAVAGLTALTGAMVAVFFPERGH